MAPGDTARLYHRLSSFAYEPDDEWPTPVLPTPIDDPLVLQDFVPYDLARLPPHWKEYPPGLPTVELPREWPAIEASAMSILAARYAPPPAMPDLAGLARLLHLSAGVVRTRFDDWRNRTWPFRAAGSAGGRFPIEVYVSSRGVDGLPDGVHWYDPSGHALVQVGPPAGGAATTLIVTGVPWRTCWKYAERGFRHAYWDAGSMLAQTLALADSAGFGPRLWTRFPDGEVGRLVGGDGVQEFPVALVGLGPGEPAIVPTGAAARGSIGQAPTEFPLVTMAQRAGDQDRLGDAWPVAPPLPGQVPASPDLDTVILRRGSSRVMDSTATVARDVLVFSLAAALQGTTVPHFVAVHGVAGLDPGLYRWPDLDRPIRGGSLREEMLLVGWDMNLARDAAFVVMAAIDLATLDDRAYREAQLEAGIVEGRLHLVAFGLGIGASGLTFLDAEIEGLLGEPLAGLLFTCVGVPTYRNKAGGPPGRPTSISRVDAGETPRSTSP
jgi:hypothetical protein